MVPLVLDRAIEIAAMPIRLATPTPIIPHLLSRMGDADVHSGHNVHNGRNAHSGHSGETAPAPMDLQSAVYSAEMTGSGSALSAHSAATVIYGSRQSPGPTGTPIAANTLQSAIVLRPRPTFIQMASSLTRFSSFSHPLHAYSSISHPLHAYSYISHPLHAYSYISHSHPYPASYMFY